jgi:hypothetical protein
MVSQGLRVEFGFDDVREKEDPNLHCQLVFVLHFAAQWYHRRLLQLQVVRTPSSNACPFPSYPKTYSLTSLAYLQDHEAFPSIREFMFLKCHLSIQMGFLYQLKTIIRLY